MFAALAIGLMGAFMAAAEPPEIAGQWSGEDWGTVVLKQTLPGEYTGVYRENVGAKPGRIALEWSPTEGRFNGTWREAEDRFGELSLRLEDDEIRGAYTTDPRSNINPAHPKLADVTWIRGAAKPVALRAAAQPLDLTSSYRTPASQFDEITAFPWRIVPRGSQTLGNVPLAINGYLCLWGEGNAKTGLVFPDKVEDIPVNRKFDTLYVYHATFFSSRAGAPVYHLTLRYANGTSSMTTICYGTHVRDWFQSPNERVSSLTDPNSKMVWRADNPDSKPDRPIKTRFFISSIPNPRPALEVKAIDLSSAKGNSAGCILAMTTGAADLLKVDKTGGK
jgi:hypothetical protein